MLKIKDEELEQIICKAAKKGAKEALADVGLDGDNAASDIKDLRSLLAAIHAAKRTAWQTFIRTITTTILVACMAGIAIKLKLLAFFGVK